jgi:hypothetical protein
MVHLTGLINLNGAVVAPDNPSITAATRPDERDASNLRAERTEIHSG